jgi:hypothetical protein
MPMSVYLVFPGDRRGGVVEQIIPRHSDPMLGPLAEGWQI